jgi:hypothetical protein
MIDTSEALNVSIIALMMAVVSVSETSASFYQTTRRNVPENAFILTAVRT